jgi:phosphopantetheinyl transferase (holo-ACP synthase)
MEEKIKEIVSGFIKLPAGEIGPGTPIDRSALQSSILVHRMYARLAEEGIVVENYAAIKLFGDLLRSSGVAAGSSETGLRQEAGPAANIRANGVGGDALPGIGLDIEEIAALPRAADFRKETFYTLNFTPAEIAYCILQADPYASLTGLFAAKEAIVKADGQYRSHPFHTLGISHSTEGKPIFPGFGLSISHAGGMAVAVAVRSGAGPLQQPVSPAQSPIPAGRKPGFAAWIAWMSLLLALAALLVALKH